MSVFFKISKDFLAERMKKIRARSSAADNSLSNVMLTSLSFGKLGRDKQLAEIKRNHIEKFLTDLIALKVEKNDKDNFAALESLLTQCKEDAAKASKDKQYDEGTFGLDMQQNLLYLKNLYQKLKSVKLLDVEYNTSSNEDNDPLSIFSFEAARYFAAKENQAIEESKMGKMKKHPKLTSLRELSDLKSIFLAENLQACKQDLDTLNKEHPQYKTTRQNRVIEWIDKILRENDELCEKYAKKLDLPIKVSVITTVSLGVPAIQPKRGLLKTYLEEAKNDIQNNAAPVTALSM